MRSYDFSGWLAKQRFTVDENKTLLVHFPGHDPAPLTPAVASAAFQVAVAASAAGKNEDINLALNTAWTEWPYETVKREVAALTNRLAGARTALGSTPAEVQARLLGELTAALDAARERAK